MKLHIYQIDAFASATFEGNPAAVCPLQEWLDDATLQSIAAENNLSETAFFVGAGDAFELRWFTPNNEVDLCGHATLATAYLILDVWESEREVVSFETRSGRLVVRRQGGALVMDFPSLPPGPQMAPPEDLVDAMGREPEACYPVRAIHGAPYFLVVYSSEDEVAALKPRTGELGANVVATAPGVDYDFVSRFFAPLTGVPEDPVTGSAHCTLTPYWVSRLGRSSLKARQISSRGGDVGCRLEGDRVLLTGTGVLYLEGEIEVPAEG